MSKPAVFIGLLLGVMAALAACTPQELLVTPPVPTGTVAPSASPLPSDTPAPGATPEASAAPAASASPVPSGSASPEAHFAGDSGIQGQVLIGPACPGPQTDTTACAPQPYQATFTVMDNSRRPVTTYQTAVDGSFRVPLAPGTYILVPEIVGKYPRADEQTVEVAAGQFTEVTIAFDSGMR